GLVREKAIPLYWEVSDRLYRIDPSTLLIGGGSEGIVHGSRIGRENIAGVSFAAGRLSNQDSLVITADPEQEDSLIVVADGLFAHPCGEQASQQAVITLADLFSGCDKKDPRIFLNDGLMGANACVMQHPYQIYDQTDHIFKPGELTPGATAVAAFIRGRQTTIASVGDCRAYRFAADGEFIILNPDDGGLYFLLKYIAECEECTDTDKKEFLYMFGAKKGEILWKELKAKFRKNGKFVKPLSDALKLLFADELRVRYGRPSFEEGDILHYFAENGKLPEFPIRGKLAESYYDLSNIYKYGNNVSKFLGSRWVKDSYNCTYVADKGDILVLASDGLNNLPFEEFRNIVDRLRNETPEVIAQALYDAVTGPKDNITIIVVKF
ncbi:MAG: PP2C family protein-serine/threonine phosphatase, partial [Candidatus Margulisiibacteriota bacterium]